MNKTIKNVVMLLMIWGLLVWGNVALIDWGYGFHQERMENNYRINNYDGKLLLTQGEYLQFKQDVLNSEVIIHSLDVY